MEVLVRKTELIRQELGSLSPLVRRQVEEVLEEGIDLEQLDALQGQLEGMDAATSEPGALLSRARQALEASRRVADQERQQDALRRRLAKSKAWLAFAHDRFRQGLDCSLELLGVSGLEAHTDAPGQPCWRLANPEDLPAQTRDKSRENTLDSLRGMKPAKAYPREWRQANPVRP